MDETPIRVRVPATTANLGPGFDCLGMALDLWNEIRVEPGPCLDISVQGQGTSELPVDRSNLVYRAMSHLFEESRLEMPSVRLQCHNEIPLKRGLGSSAAAIVSGLVAANLMLPRVPGYRGRSCSPQELLDIAVEMEGHADNVCAALDGGLRLVIVEDGTLLSSPLSLPENIHTVLFVPEQTISTEQARAVLPSSVPREDAVYNVGRVALLVNALATGNLDGLRIATKDRLHQPYRQALFPAMKVIFLAAVSAGALGVFLSGSGSTILALTVGREMTVAYEMAEAARKAGVPGQVKITKPSRKGAHAVGNGEKESGGAMT